MNPIAAAICALASAHVPPDPPQHAMPEMSNEQMIELMQMEDDASFAMLLFDELEWREEDRRDAAHVDVEAWYGTDYDKAWLRTEGNWIDGEYEGLAELFWDRIVGRWWHTQVGLRHDFEPVLPGSGSASAFKGSRRTGSKSKRRCTSVSRAGRLRASRAATKCSSRSD